jgi:hypothetical protein
MKGELLIKTQTHGDDEYSVQVRHEIYDGRHYRSGYNETLINDGINK